MDTAGGVTNQEQRLPSDPDILVELVRAGTAFEADLIVEALRAQGIPAEAFTLAGSMLQWDIAASRPFKVSVRRADLDRARRALAQLKTESANIDWDRIDTGPPEESPESPAAVRTTITLWRLLWIALGAVLVVGAVIARSRF